jgi:ribose transport system permease protein
VVAIAALFVALTIESPYFLNGKNFANIGTSISYKGIIVAAMCIVLISGGLDLSVGAVVAISGQAVAFGFTQGWSPWLAILLALLVGAGCGLVNAALIVGIGINAIIVTIGTQFVFRGLSFLWGGGGGGESTLVQDPVLVNLGNGKWLGIPVPVYVMLVVFLVMWIVLRFTRFGSNVYAIGGNRIAARLAGLRVDRARVAVYVLSSLSAALAGVVLIGIQGAAIPTAAGGLELDVLAAVIIGGTSLAGGRGSVIGALFGVFGLGVLANGINLLGISAFWKQISTGIALLLAVAIDDIRRRWKESRG